MKKLLLVTITAILTLSLTGCFSYNNPNESYCVAGSKEGVFLCEKRLTSYFDTTISLKLYNTETDEYNIDEIFTYFENTVQTYHRYFDKYNEYDGVNNVYTINNSVDPVTLDTELFAAISFAIENQDYVLVENVPLFDIALNPVLTIWHDARENELCEITDGISYCPIPNLLIDDIEFNTNPNDILLNSELMTITFLKDNMSIDMGGMAKGYVSKIIADYLDSLGITYLLNTGNSNVIAGGVNPNNDDGLYYIALTTPATDEVLYSDYFLYLKVPSGIGVVTSGNYQRFFKGIDDDIVYHHIINPLTNYPDGDTMSVTILYPDSALADILSTAIFLLPLPEAMDFVNNFDGLEAVWYNFDGTYVTSDGFSEFIYEA